MDLQEKLDKLETKLSTDFVLEIKKNSNPESLKDHVVKLSKEIEDIEELMKADAKLQTLKEQLKDLSSGYRDVKKEKNQRRKYVLLTMKINEV